MIEPLAFVVSLGAFVWGVRRWRRTGRLGEVFAPGITDLRLDEEPKREP